MHIYKSDFSFHRYTISLLLFFCHLIGTLFPFYDVAQMYLCINNLLVELSLSFVIVVHCRDRFEKSTYIFLLFKKQLSILLAFQYPLAVIVSISNTKSSMVWMNSMKYYTLLSYKLTVHDYYVRVLRKITIVN